MPVLLAKAPARKERVSGNASKRRAPGQDSLQRATLTGAPSIAPPTLRPSSQRSYSCSLPSVIGVDLGSEIESKAEVTWYYETVADHCWQTLQRVIRTAPLFCIRTAAFLFTISVQNFILHSLKGSPARISPGFVVPHYSCFTSNLAGILFPKRNKNKTASKAHSWGGPSVGCKGQKGRTL